MAKTKIHRTSKILFIPTEQETNTLIAGLTGQNSVLCEFLRDTGARIGEAALLKEIDINKMQKTVPITPEKDSNPRILPISDRLINRLNTLRQRNDGYVFARNKKKLLEQVSTTNARK
jgi:integrase